MNIRIPNLSLVILIGPSGSGKSTFALKHFKVTEVLSSDYCRAMVSDDETNQTVTREAFELLHFIIRKRLALGKMTVIDATNVKPDDRKPLVELAREYHCLPVAMVFDLPQRVCMERNRNRDDRNFGGHVIRQQRSNMQRDLRKLKWEGFRHIFTFREEHEVDAAQIERVPLWNDRTDETGPFDIIGDVHGCFDELCKLFASLGYVLSENSATGALGSRYYSHPHGRKAIFLGDLVDRGPRILDTCRLVYSMVETGNGLCVPGNHDIKLLRKLRGKNVQITHGLAESLAEIDMLAADIREKLRPELENFIDGLVSHYVLDKRKLVISHAGLCEKMQGRGSGKVRDFCLFGETTGETDEFGLPVRYNWAAEYRGSSMVVYGHTPVPDPEWLNRTVNIDTGCVFGGKLTALRYPEKEFVHVNAEKVYCLPAKPLKGAMEPPQGLTSQQICDELLHAENVTGKLLISTRLRSKISIAEANSMAALEAVSRFAVNPKWMIYLPPTMSPCETSNLPDYLEYPTEAFEYFRTKGIGRVVCQQKHMGSRAIVIVCRNEGVALKRFGIPQKSLGTVYTRTGKPFFADIGLEHGLLETVKNAMEASGFWEEFETDWVCLDCELMPWSAKAQQLIQQQYAAAGAAGLASTQDVIQAVSMALSRPDLVSEGSTNESLKGNLEKLKQRFVERGTMLEQYTSAYQRYCWKVDGLKDYKLAPFHIMATEGKCHFDKNHIWHMNAISSFCEKEKSLLLSTPWREVDVTDLKSIEDASAWWIDLTGQGGEGMVVKPMDFISKGGKGLVQPALKCRGREYLRIIYGPEYTRSEIISRLKSRGLSFKRSLAMREFALGIESLERFVRKEPLRRIHECVFGVIALESEAVDPRL
ncbi:MAG: polynucleotide kinase-phosphatase [Candidatus Wallbacteria bacterium HGW-Wallbacteria-1]|jgi:protein phosphatase|uniref:Polynucleotide kinase-phosphatase n=1 Tax=Candidatus Wallbacteria bacterium HGW-Wallbacteria-1 TaxID=2013854 RepID=A0A2N1PLP3_9BACT|nr:MAG: polynucleotide kinase-phosphatase [Candidatus Wallbacteria bacterium HGW-Wallbacteria-1]